MLRETVTVKLNLEMACERAVCDIACQVKPEQVTLVPENRQEVTTEGGLVRVGSARPTDDERHARDLLTRSEARLKATMDTLIDPHVVFQAVRDDTGQIIDFLFTEANEAACRTRGMDSVSYTHLTLPPSSSL